MERVTFIREQIEALPVHSIHGYEWDCAACHYHYMFGNDPSGKCGSCGRVVDDPNVQDMCDNNGRPCTHDALLDRDQVIEVLSRWERGARE